MSRSNPEKAVAALMPGTVRTPEGLEVRPVTLAMFAALERIRSPLVTGVDAKDVMDMLPSLYVLTHGADAIFEGNLAKLAFEWADNLPYTALRHVKEACERQLQAVVDVLPEKKKTKIRKATAGSRQSSTGARKSTGGATATYSGKRRSRRSACSSGRKSLKTAASSPCQ